MYILCYNSGTKNFHYSKIIDFVPCKVLIKSIEYANEYKITIDVINLQTGKILNYEKSR